MGHKGRKRKTGKREPNGKPQRPNAIERDEMSPVLAYRQRVFGLSVRDVKDQKGATLLGRLCLQGAVSEAQWQAGEDWLGLVNARYAATNAPRGFRTAGNVAIALDEDAEAQRYEALTIRFNAANRAIEDRAPVVERKARFEALSAIIVREVDQPRMHGTLRTALNALVRYFKLEAQAA